MSDTDDRNANLIYEIKTRKKAASYYRETANRLRDFRNVDHVAESIRAAVSDLHKEADRIDEIADEYVLRLLKAERLQKITG